MNNPQKKTPSTNIEEIEENKRLQILMTISTNVAVGIFIFIFSMYFINFGALGLSSNNGDWGTFGDFAGGILNPTIASLALYWLITSVNLQIKELKKTNEALAATVKTAKEQQNQISIQNFENLFFNLISTLNTIINNIQAGSLSTFSKISQDYSDFYRYKSSEKETHNLESFIKRFDPKISVIKGKESIKDHMMFYKAFAFCSWERFYNETIDDSFGSYFRTCYQIVKLIDNDQTLISLKKDPNHVYSKEQKKYFDIFRAQLSSYELEALFFNCISSHGNSKFKNIIEKYGLFEHLQLDNDRGLETTNRLTMNAYKYDAAVFEENKKWAQYYQDLEKTINKQQQIKKIINTLIYQRVINKNYFRSNIPYEVIQETIISHINRQMESIEESTKLIVRNRAKIKHLSEILKSKKDHKGKKLNKKNLQVELNNCSFHIYNHKKSLLIAKKNHNLYRDLNCIQEFFIILKYKINYDEYLEFIKKTPTIDNPTQQS